MNLESGDADTVKLGSGNVNTVVSAGEDFDKLTVQNGRGNGHYSMFEDNKFVMH